MIGQGGLLLVDSHPFAAPVLILQVGLGEAKKLNLNVQNNFGELHTETTLMKSGHNSLSLIRSNKSSPL